MRFFFALFLFFQHSFLSNIEFHFWATIHPNLRDSFLSCSYAHKDRQTSSNIKSISTKLQHFDRSMIRQGIGGVIALHLPRA